MASVVLVTGGNRGLGLGLALALAHSGADIAIAGRTQSELDSASELIARTGRRAWSFQCDVAMSTMCARWWRTRRRPRAASTCW